MKRILSLLLLAGGLLMLAACGNIALPTQDNVLFRDEFIFGQIGNWYLEEDELGKSAVAGEQLLLSVNAPNTIQFSTLREPTFSDFVLEVDARQLDGDIGSSYGVLFRMQSPQEFYRFEITGNGLYMLERHDADGSWVRFVDDWVDSPAINQGQNVNNRLKVVAQGPAIAVYVNDTLLVQVRDDRYTAGTIALDAGTFGQTGLQVAFDNLVVFPVGE